jgi:hypothetical protein
VDVALTRSTSTAASIAAGDQHLGQQLALADARRPLDDEDTTAAVGRRGHHRTNRRQFIGPAPDRRGHQPPRIALPDVSVGSLSDLGSHVSDLLSYRIAVHGARR